MKLGHENHVAPQLQRYWDWRAAGNFVAGGTGGGLLVFAAAVYVAGIDMAFLILVGMALIAAGLTCVWFEIGRPWRALNVVRHFGRSWMSCEAAVAPLLFAVGALALLTGQGALIVLTGVLGAAFLYSQARILAADKGIPAWRHPRCLPLVVATGLTEGAAVLAMCAPLLPGKVVTTLAGALVVLLAVRAVFWKRYLAGLRASGAPAGSVSVMSGIDLRLGMLGHLLPAVLLFAALFGAGGAAYLVIVGGLLSLYGGWMLKYNLIRRAAFTQGFVLKHLPVRGQVVTRTVGDPGWGKAA